MMETDNRRHLLVLFLFAAIALALLARAVYLQHHNRPVLQQEADNRHLRTVEIPARRGMITDRNGEPLAVSTPVYDVWVDPLRFDFTDETVGRLAAVLDLDPAHVRGLVESRRDKRFVYIKRHVKPLVRNQVMALSLPGVDLLHERRRFYPMSEAAAHLIGVTDLDGVGIEGVEKQFDGGLRGISGKKKVLRNRHGDAFENVALVSASKEGKSLALTLDHNLQYHAYKTLATAVKRHGARGGAVVLLDARNGEVLAMVNEPSFNPNVRESPARNRRNTALIDTFEPGSTVKPLVMAALLNGGYASPDRIFDTSRHPLHKDIFDIKNYGSLTLEEVVIKSSNIGMSKAAMPMPAKELWQTFRRLGFGQILGTGFPGEAGGQLHHFLDWSPRDKAGLSYGYGVSVTLLNLAYAYTAFANDGRRPALSLVEDRDITAGDRLFEPEVAHSVKRILERVVAEGTGKRAAVDGFRVAGKTGTTHKSKRGGYASDRYLALFVGFAPVSDPRLVAAVMIDEPDVQREYYGGAVAAPVFSRIMQYALRRLNVPRDDIEAPSRGDRSYTLAK